MNDELAVEVAPVVVETEPDPLTRADLIVLMQRLRNARSRVAEEVLTAETEINRITELFERDRERILHRCGEQTARDRAYISMVTAQIEVYMRRWLAENPGGRSKSIEAYYGVVRSHAQQPEVTITDEAALDAWAAKHDLMRQPLTPPRVRNWDAIRKLALAGEQIPGVTVTPRDPTVEIEMDDG